jgi:hypothetical protein
MYSVISVNADTISPEVSAIVEAPPATIPRIEQFVASHPGANIYHHPLWLTLLAREYCRAASLLVSEDRSGQIRGILPLVETLGLPFNVGSQVTRARLSSLPRTPIAGPLADDDATAVALVRAAIQMVRRSPGKQLQLKLGTKWPGNVDDGLVGGPWAPSYVLAMPEDPGKLRFGNSRNHARIKWAVNKAERSGVVVRDAETEADLAAWYPLYLDTMRWHAALPRPYRFFRAAWEALRPRDMMRLLIAEQGVGADRRVLAGSVFLMFGQTVHYAFNGRRPDALSLRPNDAIHWQAIHDACKAGYRYYDFGEVLDDNQGLTEFKSKWGSEEVMLYRYYFPADEPPRAGSGHSLGLPQRLGTAVWRRLPLRLIALLGDRIYGYL